MGEVVFKNNNNIDAEVLDHQVRKVLIDSEFFVAEKAIVPSLRFKEYIDELDHGWHEFQVFVETASKVSDSLERDVTDFIDSLEYASRI